MAALVSVHRRGPAEGRADALHPGEAGQISRETAVKAIADTYDIEDVPQNSARIAAERNIDESN